MNTSQLPYEINNLCTINRYKVGIPPYLSESKVPRAQLLHLINNKLINTKQVDSIFITH